MVSLDLLFKSTANNFTFFVTRATIGQFLSNVANEIAKIILYSRDFIQGLFEPLDIEVDIMCMYLRRS